jgi:hypothetical protein
LNGFSFSTSSSAESSPFGVGSPAAAYTVKSSRSTGTSLSRPVLSARLPEAELAHRRRMSSGERPASAASASYDLVDGAAGALGELGFGKSHQRACRSARADQRTFARA